MTHLKRTFIVIHILFRQMYICLFAFFRGGGVVVAYFYFLGGGVYFLLLSPMS